MHSEYKNISNIISKSRKAPVNKNGRFWTDTVEFLSAVSKDKGYPGFLASWAKETVNILTGTGSVNVFLAVPADSSSGIYINAADDYMFSCNLGNSLYISGRLYAYLMEKNLYRLFAGVLLHETAELIMCRKAEKKNRVPDMKKNHGEAVRLEKALLGEGEKGGSALRDVLCGMAEKELEARKIRLDTRRLYVDGCVITGEEIVAEVRNSENSGESFILQLAPGQKRQVLYSGGVFTVSAPEFQDKFSLSSIDFPGWCSLMRLIDNIYIKEAVLSGGEGVFMDILNYILHLDFYDERDNLLLNIIWMFMQKNCGGKAGRRCILYNIFLLADEYTTYFMIRDMIKDRYWKQGRYVKEYIKDIADFAYKEKKKILPQGIYPEKEDKMSIREKAGVWFSKMEEAPLFSDPEYLCRMKKLPHRLDAKPSRSHNFSAGYLDMHERILLISRQVNSFMGMPRRYSGAQELGDKRTYRLSMVRMHFWQGINLFSAGETVGIYPRSGRVCRLAVVMDIRGRSLIVFLKDASSSVPEDGFVKRIDYEDMSLGASLEAVDTLRRRRDILDMLSSPGSYASCCSDFEPFNPFLLKDKSQKRAVQEGIGIGRITLIQGPPGTGKTTVIVELILQFLKMGKKVLMCSQTNNAVDNALSGVLRLKQGAKGAGRAASTAEKIQDGEIKNIWIRSAGDMEGFIQRHKKEGYVIGATNVGTHTLDFMRGHRFDILIMDEAGKSNLVESIMPMLLVKEGGKFILVGDHRQGRPFAYDEKIISLFFAWERENCRRQAAGREKEQSLKERLNRSLFEMLIENGMKTVLLEVNYRSRPRIVELVSRLFYAGRLIPAKGAEGNSRSIIVLDTSSMADPAKRGEEESVIDGEGRGYRNSFEARLVVKELKELLKYRYISSGVRSRYIRGVTILAPYVSQVEEIRKEIHRGLAGRLLRPALEDIYENVVTIDSFQGRENDIIIISFTRSNGNPGQVGFLNELNRINVALSRAMRKMVLIGDFNTLMNVRKGPRAAYTRRIFRTIYDFR